MLAEPRSITHERSQHSPTHSPQARMKWHSQIVFVIVSAYECACGCVCECVVRLRRALMEPVRLPLQHLLLLSPLLKDRALRPHPQAIDRSGMQPSKKKYTISHTYFLRFAVISDTRISALAFVLPPSTWPSHLSTIHALSLSLSSLSLSLS